MPDYNDIERKKEFKQNYNTMTENMEGLTAYQDTFANQNKAENLLAAGGMENLGSIENELATLSAINEIRLSEREQAFKEDTLFTNDVRLNMRDTAFIEASEEINRRKNIESHHSDKSRKNSVDTANEIMLGANKKIFLLKEKLKGQGGQPVSRMDRVKSMEEIYDNIRKSDRNFAEALALNKDEEKKLKNKAELTYRCSLKRMYEREMEGLSQNSQDYRKIKRKYHDNLKIYNELMKPILEERARKEAEDGGRVNTNRQVRSQANANRQALRPVQAPVLMDKEAEEKVSKNVEVFRRFRATLDNRKYGNASDASWTEMKSKADKLLADWDTKTDTERGTALYNVMIAANRYLCKPKFETKEDKQRAKAAKEFRNFFKAVLGSMSVNCRVLALDEIYSKLDALEENKNTPEELKKQNKELFTEMSREVYQKDQVVRRDKITKESMTPIDDSLYRCKYFAEKFSNQAKTVVDTFKNTKDYFIATHKYKFERAMALDLISDNFRVDRFGRVFPEDQGKKDAWKKLFSDVAKADTASMLKIQRKWYNRVANQKLDKGFLSEEGYKKNMYEFKKFQKLTLNIENFWSDYHNYSDDALKGDLEKWNKEHPNQKVKLSEVRMIDGKKMEAQGRKIKKLPVLKIRDDIIDPVTYQYESPLLESKGMLWAADLRFNRYDEMINQDVYNRFVKNPRTKAFFVQEDPNFILVHKDGSDVSVEHDTDSKQRLVQNKDNPIMLRHEQSKEGIGKMIDNGVGFLQHDTNLEKVFKRIETREKRLDKVEKGAMENLKTICKNKMNAAAKQELKALEELFNEFLKEANEQIYAKEFLDECDMDAYITDSNGRQKLAFGEEVKKYMAQKQKMIGLYDRLEKAQHDFIRKYAGEEKLKTWKTELEKKRAESRKVEDKQSFEGYDKKQKAKRLFMENDTARKQDIFNNSEQELLKKNYLGSDEKYDSQQVDRVLNPFILPVRRDFTGAFLTEEDRKNADFNKRFKDAICSGNKEEAKNLSREFVKNVLPKVKLITNEEIDNMNDDWILKKFIPQMQWTRYIKLCWNDNINHKTNNNMFPELKTGFSELEAENKKLHEKYKNTCNAFENVIVTDYMILNMDFDINHYFKAVKQEKKNSQKMRPVYVEALKKSNDEANDTKKKPANKKKN